MAKFFWERERERERRRKRVVRRRGNVKSRETEREEGDGASSVWVGWGGLCRRDMCYLRVQRSLFAGQRGIDFLSMSVPLFRAQHGGDNSKLIHYWIRINIQAANINSQPKGGNAECVKALKQIKNNKKKKAQDPWPKISIPSLFIWVHYFQRVLQSSLSILFDFCVNLHNDFL